LAIVEGAIVDTSPRQLSNHTSTVKFYKNPKLSVWGTTSEDWATRNSRLGKSSEVIEVKAIDFRDCLRTYGMPYYMKIDIEGSDRICLESLLDLEVRPDYVSIESEKVSFAKLVEEVDLLLKLGYNAFQAVQQADIDRQEQLNPPNEGVFVPHRFEVGCSGLFGRDLPGDWLNSQDLLSVYRRIFVLYGLFGDNSWLTGFRFRRRIVRRLEKLFNRPLPGWYDTHARHWSAATGATASPLSL
jgi:hypothetical protein